jgi:hypothetical protein
MKKASDQSVFYHRPTSTRMYTVLSPDLPYRVTIIANTRSEAVKYFAARYPLASLGDYSMYSVCD